MIDPKSIQSALKSADFYRGPIDGQLGPSVHAAIKNFLDGLYPASLRWSDQRRLIAYQQEMMRNAGLPVGKVDGLKGPQTLFALEKWQDQLRNVAGPPEGQGATQSVAWPTQAMVPKFYGAVGKGQASLLPPYQMYLYDTQQKVHTISCHKKVHDATLRVFRKVLAAYGADEIHRLHLDRFFGCLNVRKMRGGSASSMHSWGIAFDFDATRNALRWGKDRAVFAKPEYNKWFEAWESEGAISLGRERNYDWMHTQFARL